MLSNAYFLAKFRYDTAENEPPAKNLQNFAKFANFADPNLLTLTLRHPGRQSDSDWDDFGDLLGDPAPAAAKLGTSGFQITAGAAAGAQRFEADLRNVRHGDL